MRVRFSLPLLLLAACFLFAACRPDPVEVEVTVVHEVEVTALREVVVEVTATPEPAGPLSEQPTVAPSKSVEPESTATATLPPIQATVRALAAQVTVVPNESSAPLIAAGDYPALLEQGCEIVRDNYVRSNFNDVDWDAICLQYQEDVKEIDDQESFWDLMESLVVELGDNHSRFVRPDRFAAEFDLPGEGQGRPWPGFRIWPAREDERLLIWDVCDIGPAADAGLRRGDIILAVNGQPVVRGENGFDSGEINQAIYEKEDEATLLVQRGPDRYPEEINIRFGGAGGCDNWSYGLVSENPRIGYIRVLSYDGNSDENTLLAIEQMEEEQPLDGLIIDVRHNPGGNSNSDIAIFTTGIFGKTGPLRDDATQVIFRIRGPVLWNETTPVALLTDGSSHSAAEYFATAMQQSGRATLVGMPTAGNTEAITGFNMADGSLIRLAFQTLVLPDGSTLEGVGVIHDIPVPLGDWGLRQVPDVQLQAAYETLLTQIE